MREREYLRVTPTSEALTARGIPQTLESLHKLTPDSSGLRSKLNPFTSATPPRFEFLALSTGQDAPVEFYYGADDYLGTLEERLRSIYPTTFDIERVEVDVASKLIHPVALSHEEFVERYQQGDLQYEFTDDEQYSAADVDAGTAPDGGTTTTRESGDSPTGAADEMGGRTADRLVSVGETVVELETTESVADEVSPTSVEKPTLTADGTILARPAVDSVSPRGVRWCGSAVRKQDWMSSLTPLTATPDESTLPAVDEPGAVLASLIDHLNDAREPLAFQVVFQRRESWQADAELRKEDLNDGRDTLSQKILGDLLDPELEYERRTRDELSDIVVKRLDAIDAVNPKRSYTTNIRAIGVPTSEAGRDALDDRLSSLAPVFDPLDGPFYEIEATRLRDRGFRQSKKEQHARAALQRLLSREVTTGRGKTRPDLVLCGAELANFILVPSSDQLTVEGTRGTRAEQQSRDPLPWPNPDLVQQFREGMAIGYALDENGSPQQRPIRIPPKLLTTHYGRFASTGSGKSKAIINDALSLRATTGGPVVIVDPKGDGMCANYLRSHYERFNGLDDVYQFRVPETIPAFSFFDIRPALEAGRNRADAIQDKVDHFHDIMRMIMGREQYGQAFVANEILSYLIKALFDEEYGSDVFGLDDLFAAALEMQRERTVPPVSADNRSIEESLTRHFAKDDHQFQVSMDAVGNRLDKLREDAHLRRIFSHVPEQDDNGEYVDNRFDFREFLDEDTTILFDLGDLRPEAQRAITLLLLSNLWDAVQVRRRDGNTDYENLTNLIIEEAAPVAATKLVSEQLLPQGRSFGLSMGLVMQFPGQVRNRNERAYDEVLNNIKTKLIGNISIERGLAESLAHEDLSPTDLRNRINTLPSGEWIAQLPSPSFGETGPAPFSVKPLPIAAGHPESDEPLSVDQADHFETVALPRLSERTQAQYGLGETPIEPETADDEGWGSRPTDEQSAPADSANSVDSPQSSFIGQATSGSASDEEKQEKGTDTTTSLFGNTGMAESGKPADEEEQAAVDESGSSPVQSGGVPVPDDELQRRGLTHDDVQFLARVLDVMNRDAPTHTLLDHMSAFKSDFENLDVQRLAEQNLLEEGRACSRKYYTVLPAGRELLGQKLKVGPGQGDIGEKTPHKVGVKLLELWLDSRDDVIQVKPYYEYDEETVFDVAGFDAGGELVWVGEAELPSNNKHAPVDDYDKQSAVDANAVWAFNRRETAVEVLDCLAEADRIEHSVGGRAARRFSDIREAVESLNAEGMTTIRSFNKLDEEFNS
ncbi:MULTISPECIES: ATP-binding protein [unclassified Haloferax]|uniref:ATP-binding protein n=1 Tax=unclassified Haloferax TaxID=2625095 RepID=UPI0028742320|nr:MULTISPECIES: ATP-binding protein [unclassified Haloferax]MDS0243615.1 ATP-binding protein [Haloferax sp. S2CR25]MDS0446736.1 ATP-binding protein [Haloferax sp. S2CR25-2]